jgi:hypothetical protein
VLAGEVILVIEGEERPLRRGETGPARYREEWLP